MMSERDIFIAALAKETEAERNALLDEACGGDGALRARVESLLREHDRLGSFLESPAAGLPNVADLPEEGRPPPSGQPASTLTGPPAGTLGDFRILREIGRGGMGVVYEAEQISLNRRVALKVLPFAAVLDERQLKRFKNEAQAAAGLHHARIVPVYGVGCERGVHYYAMQYIEGQTLAEVIEELRQAQGLDEGGDGGEEPGGPKPAESVVSGILPAGDERPDSSEGEEGSSISEGSSTASSETDKSLQAAISTGRSTRKAAYFRNVARLGIQVAEALDYAHQEGVVHRDIKPSNLILDSGGNLWVTDFGLARVESDPGLTMSGDLLGTLRYMSPEQASAKHGVVDHRSDVYSLGITLYELLALRPAFEGSERRDLLQRISVEEPPAPRKVNPAVPSDLETIVLKAMAKEPGERYATAGELGADLRRFLDDLPIRARRPSLLGRAVKWGRRHRPLVAATGLALLAVAAVSMGTLVVSNFRIGRALEREQRTLYYHRVALAHRELEANYVNRARAHLDACPPERRDWEWHHLQWMADRSVRTLEGHAHRVFSVSVRPDGERIASGSWDGTVRIWDARTGGATGVLPAQVDENGEVDYVWAVDYSPEGKRIAAGTWEAIRIWDPDARRIELEIDVDEEQDVWAVDFSPDGRRIASAGNDRQTVDVWDASTGERLLELRGHAESVTCVAYSPNGERLVSGSEDRTLRVWDAETGEPVRTLQGHELSVRSVAFDAEGGRVVSGGWDGTIRLWDVAGGRPEVTIRGHEHSVDCVAFHPDGSRIASACADSGLKLWDAETGNELLSFRGHEAPTASVAWSPDGTWIVSGSWDRMLKIWDATPRDEVRTFYGHQGWIWQVGFSPDGERIASCSRDGTIRLWNVSTGREEMTLSDHEDEVTSLAFTPDGRWLLSGSGDKTLCIWEAATGRRARVLPHPGAVSAVACTPDGRWIVSGCSDHKVRLWTVPDGRLRSTMAGHTGAVMSAACSPDGRWAATGSQDGSCRVWDLETGRELRAFLGHAGAVNSLAFSPDGAMVVSCCMFDREFRKGKIKFWDPRTGEELPIELQTHPGPCGSVAFSPNGRRVVAASLNGFLVLIDPATGEEVLAFRAHGSEAMCAAFDREGRRIVSGGHDTVLKLWESSVGE